ncbi:MAG: hypothetical protein LKK55_05075 [Olsenella sp.]|jgi:D-3-phosphoglycerate dehydrogenase|nr:hypothetical protein [Olsenella sp.]MCI2184063.1 hypothetical protein [Olsenella sp.]
MKIVIAGTFPSTAQARIAAIFPPDWELSFVRPKDIDREIATANVLIPELVQVNDALLDRAPALRLVQTGAGYNNVNLDACTRHGVIACNAAGVNANAVAEHVMAFILCWYKNLIYLNGFMKSHRDERELDYSGSELFGKTRPSIELTSLEGLCRRSDIVSVHVPLTEGAWRMINADVFRMMKGDSILINTSRGAAVDEAQLVQALKSGKISGACLDVYEEEPLAQDSLLRDMYRVILTPHTAGLPDGAKYHRRRHESFLSNIKKVMNNERPDCWLNEA